MNDWSTLSMPVIATKAPASQTELMARANALAGLPLGLLAERANWQTPLNLARAKGWAGQLIELYLGAEAGSRPEQDFAHLGIELKTIPVDERGKPLETTFVCVTPLNHLNGQRWETSNVRNKLQNVLWIPLDGRRNVPVADRCVGTPLLWQPDAEDNALLQADWEELTEMIIMGQIQQITARHGQALQLRPKAADGKALTSAVGPDGQMIETRPRGYYLKTSFTHRILQKTLQRRMLKQ